MAQVIVCCAQKGGCAKTVTVHNLSTALSQMGKKILAVDFDAQASLTICFGIEPRTPSVNIAHLMDMQAQDLALLTVMPVNIVLIMPSKKIKQPHRPPTTSFLKPKTWTPLPEW